MTIQDLLFEIKALSVFEQLLLLESLSRMVREQWSVQPRSGSALSRVRGLLKPEGQMPTDEDLAMIHDEHLMEKYSVGEIQLTDQAK
jgi:hypothetical protein